jgi:xanthine dehydrogenase accessory factor
MGLFQRLIDIEANQESAALCVIVSAKGSTPRRAGSKMLVFPDGHAEGTIGGGEMESRVIAAAREALADGKPRLVSYNMADPDKGDVGVCGGQLEVYVEPILPQPTVLLIGGGHVGKAVAELAHWAGYRLVVCDDRPEFAAPENIPQADEHHQIPLDQVTQKVKVHSQTYVILTTRNVEIDVKVLPPLLETPAAYIGVIGSRRRWETTSKLLQEQGIPKKHLERIVSPIGLELNAETPEEIAVSILAEITMLRYGGSGGRMSKKA